MCLARSVARGSGHDQCSCASRAVSAGVKHPAVARMQQGALLRAGLHSAGALQDGRHAHARCRDAARLRRSLHCHRRALCDALCAVGTAHPLQADNVCRPLLCLLQAAARCGYGGMMLLSGRMTLACGGRTGNLLAPFCSCAAVGGLQKLTSRYQQPRLRRRRASLLRKLRVRDAAPARESLHTATMHPVAQLSCAAECQWPCGIGVASFA